MLVVSRKIGESIIINDNIEIKISDIINGKVVKVAIDAPKEVLVLRKELYETGLMNQQANQHIEKDKMLQLVEELQQRKINKDEQQ